ncbi:MAG: hypothetical protein ACRDJC_15175 [Thermomicrobiales bacterium]
MDASRFDSLTRSLVERFSRRGLLRGPLVAVAGGAAGMVDLVAIPDEAAARKCPPCRRKKRGRCRKKRPDGTPCGAGKTCQRGACAPCLADFERCTQTPVDRCCSGHCEHVQPEVFLCTPAP